MPQPASTFLDNDEWLRSHMRSHPSITRKQILPKRRNLAMDIQPKHTKNQRADYSKVQSYQQEVKVPEAPGNSISPLVIPAIIQTQAPELPKIGKTNKTLRARLRPLRPNKSRVVPKVLVAMAAVVFVFGLYAGITGFRAAHVAQVQAENLTKDANEVANSKNTNGSSTTPKNPALSTIKPSATTLANYKVAPNLPRYIIIPKLDVDARVLSVGVNSQGALETPNNVFDTDWYNKSALPGEPGAMLIDGHVSSWTTHGVFYGIDTLKAGDIIKIERGDGTIFTYKVVRSQVYPSGNVDMTAAMSSVVNGQPGLNLITCTGDVIPGTSEFNERIVVFATLET